MRRALATRYLHSTAQNTYKKNSFLKRKSTKQSQHVHKPAAQLRTESFELATVNKTALSLVTLSNNIFTHLPYRSMCGSLQHFILGRMIPLCQRGQVVRHEFLSPAVKIFVLKYSVSFSKEAKANWLL